jgi:hypothetical protein
VFFLASAPELFGRDQAPDELCPRQFTVSAEYSFGRSNYSEDTTIDLSPLEGVLVVQDALIEQLSRIVDRLDRMG